MKHSHVLHKKNYMIKQADSKLKAAQNNFKDSILSLCSFVSNWLVFSCFLNIDNIELGQYKVLVQVFVFF